ncbi:hypothetical protein JQ615_24750 [Bradyrhizobium jicamae]|uniref:Uncharacterized protein n=1 Tax=Bradyrhizobium jicamae TaxID=280332 RepID=A0ABS5FP84_9BRAD|nr:hypothetical protein [Bradyrhizobium jicamae]MBR0798603.1 hypothetical protein [Bradyrhizobium jicamae]
MTDFDDLGGMTALMIANSRLVNDDESIRGAYGSLRNMLAGRYSNEVEALELNPSSEARQAVISELVNSLPESERNELLKHVDDIVIMISDDKKPKRMRTPAWQDLLNGLDKRRGPSLGSIVSGSGNVIDQESQKGVAPPDPWPTPGKTG